MIEHDKHVAVVKKHALVGAYAVTSIKHMYLYIFTS